MTTGKIIAVSIQTFVGKCLPINSTGKELKYTFLFLLTPLLLRGNMTSCQHLCNDRARRYQFGSLISHENLQDETSFLIVIFCCDESPGGKGAFIVCSLRAEVCDASLCAFRGRLIDPTQLLRLHVVVARHCSGPVSFSDSDGSEFPRVPCTCLAINKCLLIKSLLMNGDDFISKY